MKRLAMAGLLAGTMLAAPAYALTFVPGDIVVSVEGNGVWGAPAGTSTFSDNQAAPITLMEFTTAGAYVGSEVLPTTTSGYNNAISGEYGSSSEGALQLSGNGEYLTIMGYGVNYQAFNADPTAYGTLTTDATKDTALGQSGSLTIAEQEASGLSGSQLYTPVGREIALINGAGAVSTQTDIYGVFNGNNPRSVYTSNGTTFYISGQGLGTDTTGGVFYVGARGAHTATPITGLDTEASSGSAYNAGQDTRFVTEYDGTLYVSVDSKGGSGNARSFIGTLGSSPTSVYANPSDTNYDGTGPTQLSGFGNSGGTGKVTITAAQSNGLNSGKQINLSPEEYYFANSTTLYVTDSGSPKNNSASSTLGDGGLQKWSLVSGTWELDYTLSAGLNLVPNTDSSGTTGLMGLTGEVLDGEVYLYATNYTIGDLDPTYLYEITDLLSATTKPSDESFTELAAAPADSNFKGVSFAPIGMAPVPEPGTWALMLGGLGLVGGMARRRRQAIAA